MWGGGSAGWRESGVECPCCADQPRTSPVCLPCLLHGCYGSHFLHCLCCLLLGRLKCLRKQGVGKGGWARLHNRKWLLGNPLGPKLEWFSAPFQQHATCGGNTYKWAGHNRVVGGAGAGQGTAHLLALANAVSSRSMSTLVGLGGFPSSSPSPAES